MFMSQGDCREGMDAKRFNIPLRLLAEKRGGSVSSKEGKGPSGICTCDGSLRQATTQNSIPICARCGGRIIA
jgi:hypothetical protein